MANLKDENVRYHLKQGKKTVGSFILGHDPEVIRVAETAGLDFLIVDVEHGTPSQESLAKFIDVAQGMSLSLFIRCAMEDIPSFSGLFDRGLDGVIVAGAETAEDVRRVIDAVKFAPLGKRGLNPFVPAAAYGSLDGTSFMEQENNRTSVWVIAENRQLISQIDVVTQLDGLDGVFFGPYDLSVDLGMAGEVSNPAVTELITGAVQIIKQNGRSAGIFGKDADSARHWSDQGIAFLAVGFDWNHLMTAWKTIAEAYRS